MYNVLQTSFEAIEMRGHRAVELVIPEDQDLVPGRPAQPLEPPARQATDRHVPEDDDGVTRLYHPAPRAEQLVAHLLRRLVRSPEDTDGRRVTQVEVRPQPNARVILFTQLARLHPARRTQESPQPQAFLLSSPPGGAGPAYS